MGLSDACVYLISGGEYQVFDLSLPPAIPGKNISVTFSHVSMSMAKIDHLLVPTHM